MKYTNFELNIFSWYNAIECFQNDNHTILSKLYLRERHKNTYDTLEALKGNIEITPSMHP